MTERGPHRADPVGAPEMAAAPDDSHADVPTPVHRPIHVHPGFLAVVMAGGCFGALARYGLGSALPTPGGWPLPTLLINLAGAFALGVLLEALSRRGPDTGMPRMVRLLAGTGFLGAFTTYSTLAVDAVKLLEQGALPAALLYLAASLVGGTFAALAGVAVAAACSRRAGTRGNGTFPPAGRASL